MSVKEALVTAISGQDVESEVLEGAFSDIMAGDATPAQMAALLVALRMKGESVDEIVAAARALRAAAVPLPSARPETVDTCGTGGSGRGSFSISTTAAFVVAGAGVPVGVSTSSLAEAHKAVRSGASSVGLGPMFATTTKEKDRIAGPGFVTEVMRDESLRGLPHLCIGGISTANARRRRPRAAGGASSLFLSRRV